MSSLPLTPRIPTTINSKAIHSKVLLPSLKDILNILRSLNSNLSLVWFTNSHLPTAKENGRMRRVVLLTTLLLEDLMTRQ